MTLPTDEMNVQDPVTVVPFRSPLTRWLLIPLRLIRRGLIARHPLKWKTMSLLLEYLVISSTIDKKIQQQQNYLSLPVPPRYLGRVHRP
jgi:hypothetical protein